MKTFRIIGRNFRDAFKGVFRNFSLSFASISCITITLIVVAVSMVLSNNVDNFTKLVERDVTIVAFIDNKATNEQIDEIKDAISIINNVDTYEFRSKQNITKEMRESPYFFIASTCLATSSCRSSLFFSRP